MKFKFFIDKTKDEEVLVYAHEKNQIVYEIERIVQQSNNELIGYKDNEAKKLRLFNINCFTSENNKVYALTDEKFQVKLHLQEAMTEQAI